jgi:hypothetical protein
VTERGVANPARVRFVPNAWLYGADGRDRSRLIAQHLERHVRGVHATWGVALGYEIDAWGPELRVGPGLAIDPCGRPLLNPEWVDVMRPPTGSSELIVASAAAPTPEAGSPGVVVRATRPDRPIRYGEEVVLAAVDPGGAVDSSARQHVHRFGQARTAAGHLAAGSAAASGTALSWSAWIDTSAARLEATPEYFVALPAHPDKNYFGPYASIDQASPIGFRLSVNYGVEDIGQADFEAVWVDALPIPVGWTAVVVSVDPGIPEPSPGGGPCLP